jgi:hypothetical protein
VYRLAVDRAGSDRALADLVRTWIARYAEGTTQQAEAARARAASLTPERRSEIARQAVQARIARRAQTDRPAD